MQHPMANSTYNQLGGPLDWLQEKGQDLIDSVVGDPLKDLGTSIGLSDAEMARITGEIEKEAKAQAQSQADQLIRQITGAQQQISPEQSTIDNLRNQISNLTNRLAGTVPGGMTTIYAIGGLAGGFVLYKIFAGPK